MKDQSADWLPIVEYRDFYDVPRAFLLTPRTGLILFFDCPFDEKIDEYPSSFKVFAIEGLDIHQIPKDWRQLYSLSKAFLGQVALASIKFDSTRRKEVYVNGLLQLMGAGDCVPLMSA